jgi:Na+/H+ antiporter NhaD/arsenite permease-like protein
MLYIAMVSVGPLINISIAYISLLFGGILLFISKIDPMDALNELPIVDSIAFIIALFLIGGVLEYSGILKIATEYIVGFTNQNAYLVALAVLYMAFIISTFLSAGPAAATLLPICAALERLVPFKLIYAALALGILAGSSMLPWSATGGPILLNQQIHSASSFEYGRYKAYPGDIQPQILSDLFSSILTDYPGRQ